LGPVRHQYKYGCLKHENRSYYRKQKINCPERNYTGRIKEKKGRCCLYNYFTFGLPPHQRKYMVKEGNRRVHNKKGTKFKILTHMSFEKNQFQLSPTQQLVNLSPLRGLLNISTC
jgi:hypothetical protein